MKKKYVGRRFQRWTCSLYAPLLSLTLLANPGVSHALSLSATHGRITEPGVWLVKDSQKPRESLIRKLSKGTPVQIFDRRHPWLEVEVLRGKEARGYVGHRYVSPMSARATQRLMEQRLAKQKQDEEKKRRKRIRDDIDQLEISYRRSNVPRVWLVERPSNPTDTIIRKLPVGTPIRILHSSQGWSRVVVIDGEPSSGWILDSLTSPLDERDVVDVHLAFARVLEPGHSTIVPARMEANPDPGHTHSTATQNPLQLTEKRINEVQKPEPLLQDRPASLTYRTPNRQSDLAAASAVANVLTPTAASSPRISGQPETSVPFEMDYTPLLAVICVLCLLFGVTKLKQRTWISAPNTPQTGLVELNSVMLAKNEKIALVEAAGRILVMTAGTHGVQILTELPRIHTKKSA